MFNSLKENRLKISGGLILSVGIVVSLFLRSSSAKATPIKEIVFGFFVENLVSDAEKAQYLNLLNSLIRGYNSRYSTKIVTRRFHSDLLLDAAVKRGEVHISTNNLVWAGKYGYKPFITFGLFNRYESKDCVYVQKKSPYKTTRDLKGKDLVIRAGSGAQYGRLMVLAKEDPLRFSRKLIGGKNEPSIAYMVTLGQAEGAMLNDWVVEYMKMSNPGAVKNLRVLECAPACPSHLFISNAIPPKQQAEIKYFFSNLKVVPELKQFRSTLNLLGFITKPYDAKADKACEAKRTQAEKVIYGATDNYRYWSRIMQK